VIGRAVSPQILFNECKWVSEPDAVKML